MALTDAYQHHHHQQRIYAKNIENATEFHYLIKFVMLPCHCYDAHISTYLQKETIKHRVNITFLYQMEANITKKFHNIIQIL